MEPVEINSRMRKSLRECVAVSRWIFTFLAICAFGLLFVLMTNKHTGRTTLVPASSYSPSDCAELRSARVFFAHQSVGFNILSGVSALTETNSLPIVEINPAADAISGSGIFHSRIGANKDPVGKIAAFEQALETLGAGLTLDAAMLKFCYADFTETTDIAAVFAAYTQSVDRIHAKYPNLKLVHATVPVRVFSKGVQDRIRNSLFGHAANIARCEFNALLLARYVGKDPVFDVAAIEATLPDGTCDERRHGRVDYYSLQPTYSSDGGHLNPTGQRWLAAGFLHVLSQALRGPNPAP